MDFDAQVKQLRSAAISGTASGEFVRLTAAALGDAARVIREQARELENLRREIDELKRLRSTVRSRGI